MSFYIDFIDSFKTRYTSSKDNELKEELFDILRSANLSDHSFSNIIKRHIKPTTYASAYADAQKKIITWINEFEADRKQKLANYTLAIIGLFDGYVPEKINESARIETLSSFERILESAHDNTDLIDIESTLQEVFLLRKNINKKVDAKEDEKADAEESDAIHSVTTECFQLFVTCLESYKFPTPSRSRAGSFLLKTHE